ncbi:MAG: colicin V production protein [Deltaproteobacteria bacterium HGW-Deltaproteobacteria-4]|nr:MAG: colicin V production protein [Deltaproteobacteria bacterium HGW-Deltaproteobacteria-4]
MNGLDLAILLILVLFLVKGLWKGLIRQLCSLAGIVLGIFLSWSFSEILGPELARITAWPLRVSVVVVGAMLFFAGVLAFFILGFYLGKLAKQPVLAVLNRFSGALFGVIEGVVILAVVIYLLTLWPLVARKTVVQTATLTPPFVRLGAVILQDTPVTRPR